MRIIEKIRARIILATEDYMRTESRNDREIKAFFAGYERGSCDTFELIGEHIDNLKKRGFLK